ncbi:hypothetical protein [Asticcacaulis sp. 201]|uniref:hypothetical protein n=1 Tax=Asticcacaulis sp. 201 TaxID=3028787 RepID=UPI0029162449|nr:hypothetical protein [Asticcacaulis sp. 201]MDV6330127.1 hypothetical protein [Asticcacaulis sp. 201]
MQIEQCRNIIMLYRLRDRARRLVEANRKAGNPGAAKIYTQIDDWLAVHMSHAISRARR